MHAELLKRPEKHAKAFFYFPLIRPVVQSAAQDPLKSIKSDFTDRLGETPLELHFSLVNRYNL